jgi:amidohydrolase
MKNLQATLTAIRRDIHSHPELGNLEFRTSRLIRSKLAGLGIKAVAAAGTGVTALTGPADAPVVALRADIDALPINEMSDKPYRSRNPGVMHACGHDANTAMVIGAAMLLSKEKLRVRVRYIFQPNEENAGGAEKIIGEGVMDSPRVSAVFGVHISPQIPAGKIGLKYGEMMAAVDRFTIELYGGGGHAAYPHLGKDSLLAAAGLILDLQTIVSRKIDPVEPAVISVCKITGGTRFNVLAERVTLEGTARTLSEMTRKNIKQFIINYVKNAANVSKLKFRINYENLGSPLVNDENMLALAAEAAEKVLGKSGIVHIKKPSMGGEDFAEYMKHAPGCFIYIGGRLKSGIKPWHHPEFDIDERALSTGARVLSRIVLDFPVNPFGI